MPLIRDLTGMNYHNISELAFSVLLIVSVWSLLGSQHGFLLAIGSCGSAYHALTWPLIHVSSSLYWRVTNHFWTFCSRLMLSPAGLLICCDLSIATIILSYFPLSISSSLFQYEMILNRIRVSNTKWYWTSLISVHDGRMRNLRSHDQWTRHLCWQTPPVSLSSPPGFSEFIAFVVNSLSLGLVIFIFLTFNIVVKKQ